MISSGLPDGIRCVTAARRREGGNARLGFRRLSNEIVDEIGGRTRTRTLDPLIRVSGDVNSVSLIPTVSSFVLVLSGKEKLTLSE
jgi:hypothetical protein